MKVFWHADCLVHDPPHEILSGRLVPYLESPGRVQRIKSSLEEHDAFQVVAAEDEWPDVKTHILAVHSEEYVDYLETIYDQWTAISGDRVRSILRLFAQTSYALILPPRVRFSQRHSDIANCNTWDPLSRICLRSRSQVSAEFCLSCIL